MTSNTLSTTSMNLVTTRKLVAIRLIQSWFSSRQYDFPIWLCGTPTKLLIFQKAPNPQKSRLCLERKVCFAFFSKESGSRLHFDNAVFCQELVKASSCKMGTNLILLCFQIMFKIGVNIVSKLKLILLFQLDSRTKIPCKWFDASWSLVRDEAWLESLMWIRSFVYMKVMMNAWYFLCPSCKVHNSERKNEYDIQCRFNQIPLCLDYYFKKDPWNSIMRNLHTWCPWLKILVL